MTTKKKRLGNTVQTGFPEILPYWDASKNAQLGITPDTTTASARVSVHLKCPHCGREYTQKLNNAYTISKKVGTFDGYCAACRPRKIVAMTSRTPRKKTYELLGFYPSLVPLFDEDANTYACMPEDKRFIKVHFGKTYLWKTIDGCCRTAKLEEMISWLKTNPYANNVE